MTVMPDLSAESGSDIYFTHLSRKAFRITLPFVIMRTGFAVTCGRGVPAFCSWFVQGHTTFNPDTWCAFISFVCRVGWSIAVDIVPSFLFLFLPASSKASGSFSPVRRTQIALGDVSAAQLSAKTGACVRFPFFCPLLLTQSHSLPGLKVQHL